MEEEETAAERGIEEELLQGGGMEMLGVMDCGLGRSKYGSSERKFSIAQKWDV